jgi:hypothetical protein
VRDGWYRILKPSVGIKVQEYIQYCHRNATSLGTVADLMGQGCTLEEVHVFTSEELDRVIQQQLRQALEG